MAIAPSNNLLSALSQLQGGARAANAQRPAPAAQPAPGGEVRSSFAAQLARPADAIRAPVAEAPAAATSALPPLQTRPIPTRGGYLGQHVNIVV